jgi:hypothetical protein
MLLQHAHDEYLHFQVPSHLLLQEVGLRLLRCRAVSVELFLYLHCCIAAKHRVHAVAAVTACHYTALSQGAAAQLLITLKLNLKQPVCSQLQQSIAEC